MKIDREIVSSCVRVVVFITSSKTFRVLQCGDLIRLLVARWYHLHNNLLLSVLLWSISIDLYISLSPRYTSTTLQRMVRVKYIICKDCFSLLIVVSSLSIFSSHLALVIRYSALSIVPFRVKDVICIVLFQFVSLWSFTIVNTVFLLYLVCRLHHSTMHWVAWVGRQLSSA